LILAVNWFDEIFNFFGDILSVIGQVVEIILTLFQTISGFFTGLMTTLNWSPITAYLIFCFYLLFAAAIAIVVIRLL